MLFIYIYIYIYITYIYIHISFSKIFERWNGSSRDPYDQLLSYSGTAPQPCPSVQGFFSASVPNVIGVRAFLPR